MLAQHSTTLHESAGISAGTLLGQWLQCRLTNKEFDWLQSQLEKVVASNSDRDLHITLGLIPRTLGRADLNLTSHELQQADDYATGWRPVHWSIDTTARVWVLSHLTKRGSGQFGELIADLCRTADLAESIAIYSGLPIYPFSRELDRQVAEGLRSNIKAVFEAIAHHSPYPAEHFNDNRWNHMVLKALFIGSRLSPINGLDDRANEALANTLCDYAHERRAAGRSVTFELWRCVGPFADDTKIDDIARAVESDNLTEQRAALLALNDSKTKAAQNIIATYPLIAQRIHSGELNWATIESTL